MFFTKRPTVPAPLLAMSVPVAKPASRLTVRKDEAARRRLADTDGARRRQLQLVEDNRLR
ncbi:hypothetical protein WHT83_21880 [Aminobacter sp. P9b]|uniref:hypothetical protein n=1 Tax=unclassified Aminobacter TaxID=2644704 RepID=UPI000D505952|nr:hypothetical protein [Aminobacter sp. MSH1]AWC22915.1 hypothetical protein CO731_02383 [Aminobacter sp. MSH1]